MSDLVATAQLTRLAFEPHNPAAVTGVKTRMSDRYELYWRAGERGHPCINADLASGTEATREPADKDFEVLGTNATSALAVYYAEGGIALVTAGASGDSTILAPHLDTNQTGWTGITWGTDKQTVWECHISTAADIAAIVIWAGLKLTNTSTTATDNDQVFFRFAPGTNSGEWQAIYSIGGTDTAVDTDVVVAASTKYRLKVAIDADRVARMWINDALVATSTALTDATDLIPYIGVQASAAAAKTLYVFEQAISRQIG
jgi:hypothetical protein